ncbi:hypothetical protein SmJEL517_g03381 [Synchytrium microbalum]|uniref:Uncharacterized protein n=1 Tax=Synchytrium microbalum TaxID=1806994 RepID=A0A507C8T8_9FUNG|nr:uncharacterized protein SmJEL517_g03381 [Synchytrium microbalum]TPX33915.1 hypothetical protein SmJEL517_g03381 [Synchytrium microbalum]
MLKEFREWIRLKNYQYELTFGLYMLEGWEKTTFSKYRGIPTLKPGNLLCLFAAASLHLGARQEDCLLHEWGYAIKSDTYIRILGMKEEE